MLTHEWILILTLVAGNPEQPSVAMTSIAGFHTKTACELAGETWANDMNEWPFWKLETASCVLKGQAEVPPVVSKR